MDPIQPDMDRRLYLRVAMKLLLSLAVLAVAALLIGYLLPEGQRSDDPRREAWGRQIDVRGIGVGELRRFDWPGGAVGVYRRSAEQIRALSSLEAGLSDPHSRRSRQPEAARNPHRSLEPEYFVFLVQSPGRGCRVRLADAPPPGGVAWVGGFYDPCSGTWFDPAGRAYGAAKGGPESLTVPPHRYEGKGQLRLAPPG